jgi:hypothetical protein
MLLSPTQSLDQSAGFRSSRKRKADNPPENNERLSKRLSLLNLGMSILYSYHNSFITIK